jgi:hypothetical protein
MSAPSREQWFGPRQYGYGVTPIARKGWMAFGLYLACVLALAADCALAAMRGQPHTLISLVLISAVTAVFLVVTVKKGPASWRAEKHSH